MARKPIYWIHNLVFLPLIDGNKYVEASISGFILGPQFTKEEILSNHPNVKPVDDLHDLVSAWGKK